MRKMDEGKNNEVKTFKVGDGTPGPGRPKGVPNKNTALLKDAILDAATKAGGKDGLSGYLKKQADENPTAFMTLLGKVLPMQVTGENGGAIMFQGVRRTIVDPKQV